MLEQLKKIIKRTVESALTSRLMSISEREMLLLGRSKSDFNKIYQDRFTNINDFEFGVFSQSGEDGIIQYLINNIDISSKTFIEFGVENYQECNTRFLLMNNNWSGLVIDGSEDNIRQIKESEFYWKHDLIARTDFITAENINEIFLQEKFSGEIGLLSIDIDGNDYWVWKAITSVQPDILILEYNSLFGYERHITVPYEASFQRHKFHFSGLAFGASLPALHELSLKKGYVFVGCNEMGNNAFFVKKEKIGNIRSLSVQEGYKEAKFRESRDKNGILTYKKGEDKYNEVKGVEVYNTRKNQIEAL